MNVLDFLFCAFVAVVCIQVFFYSFFFSRFAFIKPKKETPKKHPVSVIIYVKNEADNLQKIIPSILSQVYPDFEIVLINNASKDHTLQVMEHFKNLHNNIKIVDVKNTEAFWGNKKYALTLGIKASTKDFLLFTEVNCKPISKYWIKNMMGHFDNEKTIILGYGGYSKIKKSLLNKLIRFESLATAINYFSFALAGMPYMGVGRNLAYTKKEFFNSNGFINHIKVRSGDDDLFVNQAATKNNTAISISKNSFIEASPVTTFKDWVKQKKDHIATTKYYKLKHKILLNLFYISTLQFWVLTIFLFVSTYHWQWVLCLFLIRLSLQFTIFSMASKKLNETDFIALIPFFECFLIITQLTIFINNLLLKLKFWK